MKSKNLIHLFDNLESYMGSGASLDQALRSIADYNSKHRKSMLLVIASIESGGSLSSALRKHLKISQTLVGLIEHGEMSGRLVEALNTARSILERHDDLKNKCLSALVYPVVIAVFAALLTIGLIRGVMPQIIPMLKSLNVALPLLTRVVIGISDLFLKHGLYISIGLAIIGISFVFLYRRFVSARLFCQYVLLRTPIVGSLVYRYHISGFLRSCGSLVESGSPLDLSYERTVRTISFFPLKNQLAPGAAEISRGVRLSSVLGKARIPQFIGSLISAGESSGNLGNSLVRVSNIIDKEIEHLLKRLTSLIEPIMMAGMGIVVGAIALSIMLPIYDLSRVLQR